MRALLLALVLACTPPILVEAQLVTPEPIACPEAFQCPSARRWAVYGPPDNLWMDCWCREGTFADWTFPIYPGDEERVRSEWEKYRQRGCKP